MEGIKKIKSEFVKKQAQEYLSNITLNDVIENFIYNGDMGMFDPDKECDENDPFDYYEQVEEEHTELKEMVLNRIKELLNMTVEPKPKENIKVISTIIYLNK